jgi:23S rRNA (adenine2503-C2)-methyltransferase
MGWDEGMIDLKGLTPREIDRFCTEELEQRPGQGLRLAAFLFRKGAADFDSLAGLNRQFRERLRSHCVISRLSVERTETAQDGTLKLLYRLEDGHTTEGVLIPGPDRFTLCVSTQVGCASGCGFCLTASGGLVRNLTPAEIVNQVLAAERHTAGRRITNIVLMGTGEPLANYDAVMAFLETAGDRHGLGFSPRKTTLSTCGHAPMIERLADQGVEASLAVSLNATTDAVRDRIMPVNRVYPLARLLRSMRYYTENTGRTVTIEYVLLRGVNDSREDAARLVELSEGLPSMVNILSFNPFPGCAYERPEEERLSLFRDVLVLAGRIAVVRKSRGRDISAACGQLRAGAGGPHPVY